MNTRYMKKMISMALLIAAMTMPATAQKNTPAAVIDSTDVDALYAQNLLKPGEKALTSLCQIIKEINIIYIKIQKLIRLSSFGLHGVLTADETYQR